MMNTLVVTRRPSSFGRAVVAAVAALGGTVEEIVLGSNEARWRADCAPLRPDTATAAVIRYSRPLLWEQMAAIAAPTCGPRFIGIASPGELREGLPVTAWGGRLGSLLQRSCVADEWQMITASDRHAALLFLSIDWHNLPIDLLARGFSPTCRLAHFLREGRGAPVVQTLLGELWGQVEQTAERFASSTTSSAETLADSGLAAVLDRIESDLAGRRE